MSVRKNTLINLVGYVIPMAVMLVTVPLYLKLLGDVRYGVLSLVWLVLGYFSFLEMGLGKATANQIAKAHDALDAERAEIFWTAIAVNACMGLVASGVLWLVGDYAINHFVKMPDDFREEFMDALPWMVATLPLALVSSVLNGALEGRSQFFVLNILQITANVAFQLVPLLFAWLSGPSLAIVIPAAVVTRAIMNFWFFRACQKTVPLKGRPAPTRSRVRLLFSYGGWVAITSAVAPLLDTVERLIIGAVVGAAAVTHYTVPMQLVGKIKIIPGALSRAMFPTFSSSDAAQGIALSISALRLLSFVMTLIVLAVLLVLRPFLELWIGAEVAGIATPIGEILLIGIWFNSVAHLPYFLLQAQGKPDLVAKVHLVELPLYLIAAWVSAQWFGLAGVAIVWVLRCIVEAIALLLFGKLLFVSSRFLFPQAAVVALSVYLMYWLQDISFGMRLLLTIPLILCGIWMLQKTMKSGRLALLDRPFV
jgi:O-antigen/teichoic acid export membrane protein